jgi:hypothetical protein
MMIRRVVGGGAVGCLGVLAREMRVVIGGTGEIAICSSNIPVTPMREGPEATAEAQILIPFTAPSRATQPASLAAVRGTVGSELGRPCCATKGSDPGRGFTQPICGWGRRRSPWNGESYSCNLHYRFEQPFAPQIPAVWSQGGDRSDTSGLATQPAPETQLD